MSEPTFEELMTIHIPDSVTGKCRALGAYRDNGKRQPACIVCGGELPPRRRSYCSDEHARWFVENHDWTTARHAAWTENNKVNCVEIETEETYYNHVTKEVAKRIIKIKRPACSRCGEAESTYGANNFLHTQLEVDHIIPLNGSPRGKTCLNHQTNLRVVCHRCHLILTAEQRAAGLIGKRKTK